MYTKDMSLNEAKDWLAHLEMNSPKELGYLGAAGLEQHGWDIEDIKERIEELEEREES